MVDASTIRYAVGIIGNFISVGLFLAPVPTFWRIFKKKDVEEFQFLPYVATVMNCMLWVFYGTPVVTKDNVLVVSINVFGLVVELIYLTIFVICDRKGKARKRVFLMLCGEVVAMVIIILVTLLAMHDLKKRAFVVGIICDIFNIGMYASPLGVAYKVYKTKSVKYMPFFLSVAGFLNGLIWTAYSLIMRIDWFILASNGIGSALGAIQLCIYGYYYCRYGIPKGEEDDVVKPPAEIQMSGANAAESRV